MDSSGLNSEPRCHDGLPPFSWSLRRRRLYEFCLRAYYFHYYAAAGGWDRYATESQRLTYRLKYLCSVEEWLPRLLSEAVRQTFIRRRPQVRNNLLFMKAILRQECARRFRQDWNNLRDGRWRDDPKTLNLAEVYYGRGEDRLRQVFTCAQQRLEQLFNDFCAHPLATVLSDTDSAVFRHFRVPLEIAAGDLSVWLAPTLIWQPGDRLHMLHLAGQEPMRQEDVALIAALDRLMAEKQFNFDPERVEPFFYFPGQLNQTPVVVSATEIPFMTREEALYFIAASAAPMLEKAGHDNRLAAPSDFPGWNVGTDEICASCRFRQLCRTAAAANPAE